MVQRLASTFTLAVVALKASSSLALPMMSEDATDLTERNFDDSMDFEARELGASWLDDELIARKVSPPKSAHGPTKPSSSHPAPGASSAHVESLGATPLPSVGSLTTSEGPGEGTVPTGAPLSAPSAATSTEPMMSNAATETQPLGSIGGAEATKTVTHTIHAKPTPCGMTKKKKGKGFKGKGKGFKGKGKQRGHNGSKRAVPIASTSHLSEESGSPSVNSVAPSHATLAPSAGPSGSPPEGNAAKTITKTMTGKDGSVTVMHMVHATPTGCVEKHKGGPFFKKPGPMEKGKGKKPIMGNKQNHNDSHNKGAKPQGQKPRIGVKERDVYEIDELD
ncbi:hypothetical protein NP233_g12782 [Leucocoprinus birnbaumii]|uniref:Uncharacterized protein n=1 Tax=Leucocoprinus birnbaumii TaxID=56174 RepID=A0AAD5VE82_9AGAR|nr:hypothetical protein NP233_g12782 [Leucocoprinus birnbaumii]